MSDDVIDFETRRTERQPHLAGEARCLSCGHRWAAVAPVGADWLECPQCGLEKGVFSFPYRREGPHLECNCGNDLFHVTPEGVYCPNCNTSQEIPS